MSEYLAHHLLIPHETSRSAPLLRAEHAKRAFDLVFATVVLLLLAPLIGILWALVRMDGGPGFHSQERIGRRGRRFCCLKFRTMSVDAELRLQGVLAADPAARAEWDLHQKLRNDPRVTTVGRFLRKTSLDELPQLFNVLGSDMSIVGPRPIVSPDLQGYPSDNAYFHSPEFALYLRSTPGLTGLWQVSGRNRLPYSERIRLDGVYVRNWSFQLDMIIVLRTVGEVLWRRSGV